MIFVFQITRGLDERDLSPIINNDHFLRCFDEVQDDLAEMADNVMEDSMNILELLVDAVRWKASKRVVFSGTALNFDKLKAVVDISDEF